MVSIKDKSKCCGCGACETSCPALAIQIKEDVQGFLYPEIDQTKCIDCGKCDQVCQYKNTLNLKKIKYAYVGVAKNTEDLKHAASGGAFTSIAKNFVMAKGVVFGCSMEINDETIALMHIPIDTEPEIRKLQGSKYAQSNTAESFSKVYEYLKQGDNVLYSGTPCQIAGLKSYLGKDYKNLYTIDIICHGVPNLRFLKEYYKSLEKKYKGKILAYNFRDKAKGNGYQAKIHIQKQNGRIKVKRLTTYQKSYFFFYQKSKIYRDSCYQCPYSNKNRTGDLTIGDFWGLQKIHPELLKGSGGNIDETKGVSSILVNSQQGERLLELYGGNLLLYPSDDKQLALYNEPLRCSPKYTPEKDIIYHILSEKGYDAVEKYYRERAGLNYYWWYLKDRIPLRLKVLLKRILCL